MQVVAIDGGMGTMTAFVGPDKSSLDCVDTGLSLILVVTSFGRFLKYVVDIDGDIALAEIAGEDQGSSRVSARLQTTTPCNLPIPFVCERNKRQAL